MERTNKSEEKEEKDEKKEKGFEFVSNTFQPLGAKWTFDKGQRSDLTKLSGTSKEIGPGYYKIKEIPNKAVVINPEHDLKPKKEIKYKKYEVPGIGFYDDEKGFRNTRYRFSAYAFDKKGRLDKIKNDVPGPGKYEIKMPVDGPFYRLYSKKDCERNN